MMALRKMGAFLICPMALPMICTSLSLWVISFLDFKCSSFNNSLCKKISLVPRPAPSFPSLAVRLSGRGPGTFSHVSDVTDKANYANVGVM